MSVNNIFTQVKDNFLKYWLLLGGVLYVASHLPEVPFVEGNPISPFQLYQLLTLLLFAGFYLSSTELRGTVRNLYRKYKNFVWAVLAFLGYVALNETLFGSGYNYYSVALLAAGMGFGAAIFALAIYVREKGRLFRVIAGAGVVLSLFSIWQFIGDNLGAPTALTQILGTTTWTQIDFSRANGLSAEPQFLTTILLLPMALLSWRLFTDKSARPWRMLAAILLIDTAVLLGLSRGGFLAHTVLAAAILIVAARKKLWGKIGWRVGAAVVAFCLTLLLVGWSGTLPSHQGPRWVIYRYIEQASGGLIPLHTRYIEENKQVLAATTTNKNLDVAVPPPGQRDDVGVIDESTTGRIDTYKAALELWRRSSKTVLFGIGWGNFGAEASEEFNGKYTEKAITNNQTVQIITELGVVGVALFGWLVVEMARIVRQTKDPLRQTAAFGLLAGIAIQLQFYSALHLAQIWFSLAIVLLLSTNNRKKV